MGTCINAAVDDGSPGECDDGVKCNGREACMAGLCAAGPAAECCAYPDTETFCSENAARCSWSSVDPGAICGSNEDCPGGVCEHCQPACASNADCNDGLNCNGIETCVAGACVPGQPPCGAAADCFEGECSEGGAAKPCNVDADCRDLCERTPGPTAPFCLPGRCCVPDGADPNDDDCSHKTLAQCAATHAQSQWYSGDNGSLAVSDEQTACGPAM